MPDLVGVTGILSNRSWGSSAGSRPVIEADLSTIADVARDAFRSFRPGYVSLWSADPANTWAGTEPDARLVAGRLGDLRSRSVPAEMSACPASDLAFYERYSGIHEAHCWMEPAHRLHARVETRADLSELVEAGSLLEVFVSGRWAGVVAGKPDVASGLRGVEVVELLIDLRLRGRGYGKHLSTLLARAMPQPDEQFLFGTVHANNHAAYRAALAAGRIDVGGDVHLSL